MPQSLLSKVIRYTPGLLTQIATMFDEDSPLMLYTSDQNQILLPEAGDFLALSAYFELNSIPYKVCRICNGEDMSPDGLMPFIVDKNGQFVSGYKAIVESIQRFRGELLDGAEPEFVMMNLLTSYQLMFHASEESYLWTSDEVYKSLTVQSYGYAKPWPVNHLLCWLKRREVLSKLDNIDIKDSKSFAFLCEKLESELDKSGDHYLYGDSLSELDTLVYGHLKAIKDCASNGSITELWDTLQDYKKVKDYMDFIMNHLSRSKQ